MNESIKKLASDLLHAKLKTDAREYIARGGANRAYRSGVRLAPYELLGLTFDHSYPIRVTI